MNRILVTGLVRSGTSWIGKMLSLNKSTIHYFEPFHPDHRNIFGEHKIDYYFLNSEKDDAGLKGYINSLMDRKYRYLLEFNSIKNVKDLGRYVLKTVPKFINYSHCKDTILIKDPYAFFLSEFLYKDYNFNNLMIIRNPFAFVYSFTRHYSWDRHKICFSILNQKSVIENWNLFEYIEDLERYAKIEEQVKSRGLIKIFDEQIRIERASLIWKIFANVYIQLRKIYNSEWLFVKYEDIALNPLKHFEMLYKNLNLDYNPSIEKKINSYCQNNRIGTTKLLDLKRNSIELIDNWKNYLSSDQIKIIKNIVNPELQELSYSD